MISAALLKYGVLFLYLCGVVSFVWAALNRREAKRVIYEGLKTFFVFTACAVGISFLVHFLS
ncbi:MAG: hypothetical protein HYS08_03990 [Chlamydiae bacterium]|nr:hypothetical protein [Chlamydiota bacterium]MBI3266077.1 hypothetical protein [Chlamydiota bacterium]